MKKILLLSLLAITYVSFAQDKTFTFRLLADTTETQDSIQELNFNSENKGTIIIHKNADLDEITSFATKHKNDIDKQRIEGYRIQIFFNESKASALGQKANFLNKHNKHKAYIDYLAPNYRVRVGNFRTRMEAERLKQNLLAQYPTCIVIKDMIELPEFNIEN